MSSEPNKYEPLKSSEPTVGGIIFKQESYRLIGACLHVYREKGCGFLEAVYQECMAIELDIQGIPFEHRRRLELTYRGQTLRQHYEPDFVCFNRIILELKAVTELSDEHRAQIYNYLRATGHPLGLLVNFGHYPGAQIERIVATKGRYSRLS